MKSKRAFLYQMMESWKVFGGQLNSYLVFILVSEHPMAEKEWTHVWFTVSVLAFLQSYCMKMRKEAPEQFFYNVCVLQRILRRIGSGDRKLQQNVPKSLCWMFSGLVHTCLLSAAHLFSKYEEMIYFFNCVSTHR